MHSVLLACSQRCDFNVRAVEVQGEEGRQVLQHCSCEAPTLSVVRHEPQGEETRVRGNLGRRQIRDAILFSDVVKIS